ncbi:hypothetical protein L6452_20124 [Arctium lappa]|uniref:Uncharacterized protein n=1 Tax=Arctium lappa TaxID=4217 RepID=A0ACB9BBD9_ARCLA|nr:hypothetical protein L6452_20124 [Arctium lappa]
MAMSGPVSAPPTVCPCGPASGMANLLVKGVSTTDGGDDDGSTVAKIDSNSKQPWKISVTPLQVPSRPTLFLTIAHVV